MATGAPCAPPRLFAVSDVHADFAENRAWCAAVAARGDFKSDALIVAGDVSHELPVLRETLEALSSAFADVFFCPGNHELWVESGDSFDSLGKHERVRELCAELGVHTAPKRLGGENGRPFWVVPTLSYHHAAFDTEPDIDHIEVPPYSRVMSDFRRCRWPEPMDPMTDDVAQHFDALNDGLWAEGGFDPRDRDCPVISFSHFLPDLRLCPEKRYLTYPELPKAIGSNFLRDRIARLRPDVHVHGHTHFGFDLTFDGVRHIQGALARPDERANRWRSLSIDNLALEPVFVYDSAGDGRFADEHTASWSTYYKQNERDPTNLELASWVQGRFKPKVRA